MHCIEKFEIMQSITAEKLTHCPECGNEITRLISLAVIHFGGRQANQYPEVKSAKYWRDNDGNKWPVTAADGSTKSPTVSRNRKRTDEEVRAVIKQQKQESKRKRNQDSYNRFVKRVKKT